MPTIIHIPRAASPFGSRVPIGLNGRVSYIPTGEDYVASDAEVAALQALNIQTQQFLTTVPDGFILLSQRTYGSRVPVTINGRLVFLPTGVPFQPDASQLAALIAAGRTYRSGGSAPVFTLLPSIVGTPRASTAMVFDDGVPPLGFLATRRALIDANTNAEIAAATAPTLLAYTPTALDVGRVVFYRLSVALLGVTITVDSATKTIDVVAGDGRRTNAAVAYGYGDLTRNGFGAVSLNSDYLGITRPGLEKPVSYSTATLTSGTATHWNTATSTTNTPTKKAALTDASYVFKVIATFADTTTEEITLTINRLTGVYTVGQADNFVTVGQTDTAVISGNIVEFAAGVNFRVAGVTGRKFFASWRPAARTIVRPHDRDRMGFPPAWQYQSAQNITFRQLDIAGDLNPSGLNAAHTWGLANLDTNKCTGLIHEDYRIAYSPEWYSSSDAGTSAGACLKTSGADLQIGATVIPVLGGTAGQTAFLNRGMNVGDRFTFVGDPTSTVYTCTKDNITYVYDAKNNPYCSGGSFECSPPLQFAIGTANNNIFGIATPNAFSIADTDDSIAINDSVISRVRGIFSGGLNANARVVVNRMKCRKYYDNVVITGTNPPQRFEFYDCTWMSPDRVSKFLHIDAIQVALVTKNPYIKIRRCRSIQADGTGYIQGLFQRGDGPDTAPFAADGSEAGTFDVKGYLCSSASISAINFSGLRGGNVQFVQGIPAVGNVYNTNIDTIYANAMSANFVKDALTREPFFAGSNFVDNIVMFSDIQNQISASGLTVGTGMVAHGGRLYTSAEAPIGSPNFGKQKVSAGYVTGNFYTNDPIDALAAIPYASLSFDAVVAAFDAAYAPKAGGAYQKGDSTYKTAIVPGAVWNPATYD